MAGKAGSADPDYHDVDSAIAVSLSFRCDDRVNLSQAYEAWLTTGLASSLFSSMIVTRCSGSAERLIAALTRSSPPCVCVYLPASGIV